MKLVIEIQEETYNSIQCGMRNRDDMEELALAVEVGTPLPKGCKLIDANEFKQNICTYQQTGCGSCEHQLCCPEDAPAIIETD